MAREDRRELQLLPSSSSSLPSPRQFQPHLQMDHPFKLIKPSSVVSDPHNHPSLDLKLSISLSPPGIFAAGGGGMGGGGGRVDVEALRWQAAEQIRLAAIEKAYAERMRELSRREMELAQSEFARARQVWQRAREGVERAERLKERATRKVDPSSFEITCHSCSQRFRP